MSGVFERARQAAWEGGINWLTDDIRALLVDLNDFAQVITGATNATPIVVTSTAHGYTSDQLVSISGVVGNTAANGLRRITVIDANTFSLQDPDTGANIAGNGVYTSGGLIVNLSSLEFLSSIPAGARLATSPALSSKTTNSPRPGVMDAADPVFSGITTVDAGEACIVYKHTGVDGTARLIALYDEASAGLPFGPFGSAVTLTWQISSGVNRLFRG